MWRAEEGFDVKPVDQNLLKASEHLNESIKAAQKCLTHGDFHKYADEFQKAYDAILNDMCIFTDSYLFKGNGNIEMYGLKMVQYIQRIQDLRILLNKVNIDANKPLAGTEKNDN